MKKKTFTGCFATDSNRKPKKIENKKQKEKASSRGGYKLPLIESQKNKKKYKEEGQTASESFSNRGSL